MVAEVDRWLANTTKVRMRIRGWVNVCASRCWYVCCVLETVGMSCRDDWRAVRCLGGCLESRERG